MSIQISFDTEGITVLSIEDANGQVIHSVTATAGMADIGSQTEGFLEGVARPVEGIGCEPDPEGVIPVVYLFAAFPAACMNSKVEAGGVTFGGSAIPTTFRASHHTPAGEP